MSDRGESDPARPDVAQTLSEPAITGSIPASFGFKIRRVQIAYNRYFTQCAVDSSIPVNQIGALSLIVRNPGITPKDLAALLNRDAGQVTPILKHLDSKGLIERQKCASDSRSHSLHATTGGLREYRRLQVIISATEETFLGEVLQQRERQQLLDMLDRLETAARRRADATKRRA
jgi:DNA-binding MarR family transcriptional regulator